MVFLLMGNRNEGRSYRCVAGLSVVFYRRGEQGYDRLLPQLFSLPTVWGWRTRHHNAAQMFVCMLPPIRETHVQKGCSEGGSLEFLVIACVSASYFRKERL